MRRDPEIFSASLTDDWLTLTVFGLQWHITNACDLHCRHCYDRSKHSNMRETEALHVLDELERFCKKHWVVGDISFTGGNPFLYPGFPDLYREAVRRGFQVDILGNPVERDQIEAICEIRPPNSYQMSLEGRRSHNDFIRGKGHYDRVMDFADVLRELEVPCHIMLTATDHNLKEVLPLAALLKDKIDVFTFSRLCLTGEGAALHQPDPAGYRALLKRYLLQAEHNDTLSLKENLFCLVLDENGYEVSNGCTGFGCGAAFNCVSVLPDGEVYACRRFPSLLGNIQKQTLEELYFSDQSAKYRRGMRACDGCSLRHACGGCMAASGHGGGEVAALRDPFCWKLWPVQKASPRKLKASPLG